MHEPVVRFGRLSVLGNASPSELWSRRYSLRGTQPSAGAPPDDYVCSPEKQRAKIAFHSRMPPYKNAAPGASLTLRSLVTSNGESGPVAD